MITIFDIFAFALCIAGVAPGAVLGGHYFGTAGAIIGGLIGGYLGLVIGRLPGIISKLWVLRQFDRKTSDELRQVIRSRQYYIYHLAFAQLMARGEDIQQERTYLFDLLSSDATDQRLFGWRTLQSAFPEIAAQIPDYDPNASTEACRNKAQQLNVA